MLSSTLDTDPIADSIGLLESYINGLSNWAQTSCILEERPTSSMKKGRVYLRIDLGSLSSRRLQAGRSLRSMVK